MPELSITTLVVVFLALLALSAYFSASETAMMVLNRYRLRHLADQGHRSAVIAQRLLDRPDRLIGLILLGNNFVNIAATTVALLICIRLLGEQRGIWVTNAVLPVIVLLFAETTPKTLAAFHPERVAFASSPILRVLMWVAHPVVWLVNLAANAILRVFGVRFEPGQGTILSREELRTAVKEAGAMLSRRHSDMLFGILDLERMTVDDIMIPRTDIDAINLSASSADLRDQLTSARHTRLPCYVDSLDNLVGVLHLRKVSRLLATGDEITLAILNELADEPYFIPSGTDLYTQLHNFQRRKQRLGIIVDEYGDIEGLLTLDGLLEEIVGEFTTHPQVFDRDVSPQSDGSFLIDGTTPIREINRQCGWSLPEQGPKTLNGLILETLESIPDRNTSLKIGEYFIEVISTTGQAVRSARVRPPLPAESPESTGPGG